MRALHIGRMVSHPTPFLSVFLSSYGDSAYILAYGCDDGPACRDMVCELVLQIAGVGNSTSQHALCGSRRHDSYPHGMTSSLLLLLSYKCSGEGSLEKARGWSSETCAKCVDSSEEKALLWTLPTRLVNVALRSKCTVPITSSSSMSHFIRLVQFSPMYFQTLAGEELNALNLLQKHGTCGLNHTTRRIS